MHSKLSFSVLLILFLGSFAFAQTKPSTSNPHLVTEVNETNLKNILKPNGKPLLVNFWATWCDPCREEFPELVKIDNEYKGKIDFVTVSLDDITDINAAVPKFLGEMKADMPAYLLKTDDESAVISGIAKDWSGGLPFTILYNEKGEIAYFRQGKVIPATLRTEITKLIP
ncbi:MAG TPA: TlpA disulfide reductase family protein [Pyrinomonadaceae bacterium]|nr:TlpA disulfide reductase family protein [Pyrinomonadaceae bacterium]